MFKNSALTLFGFFSPLLALANTLPLSWVNDSGFPDSQVFFLVKALDPATGKDCFMDFDLKTGVGNCQVVSRTTSSQDYALNLAQIGQLKYLQLPQVLSGRIYVSIGHPVELHVNSVDQKIIDSDGFKPRDPNYYILHDKIEFSYNALGTWFNPTAVDFFSLPLSIHQPGAVTSLKQAGLTASHAEIYDTIHQTLAEHDTTDNQIWNTLLLTYHENGHPSTPLRFVAPGKAMVQGVPGTTPFDERYLNNSAEYGFNYIDDLWQYYESHTLKIDISEIQDPPRAGSAILTGRVEGDGTFTFRDSAGQIIETLEKPKTSIPFFAGAGAEFDHSNNTPKAIIVRQLTSAFTVGLLPAPDGTVLDKHFFEKNRSTYYTRPATGQGPWYDLYGKALHAFGETQPIYTFAYDDALGQDGTLHDSKADQISPVTLRLGDLSGVRIPDPFTDPGLYTIHILIGENSVVKHEGKVLQTNTTLTNRKMPFSVEVNGHPTKIYVKYPMVKPYYDGADGIVIEQTGSNSATLIFPGK